MLGRYEVVDILGEGVGSIVYLTRHTKLKAYRAVKCISKTRSMPTSIFSEANLTDSLRHPGIPIIYDMEEDDQRIYVVEEYVQGESLEQILLQQESVSQEYIVKIGLQLCDILIFLHNHKPYPILYQDLKPAHIIVCGNQVKLIDFGIAGYISNEEKIFQNYGTRGFAAPEQYYGGCPEIQADIYAFGAVLDCFAKKNRDSCSKKLRDIIAKCMRQNPKRRYESVEEVKAALNRVVDHGKKRWNNLLHSIAVVGASPGAGVTHIAVAFNCYLNRRGQRCMYSERMGGDVTDCISRMPAAKVEQNVCVSYQHFRGSGEWDAAMERREGMCIRDYGTDLQAAVMEEGDLTILVVNLSVWRQEAALKAYEQVKCLPNLVLLCNGSDRQQAKKFAALTGRRIYYFPYDSNPFREYQEKEALFTQMLNRKE